MSIHVYIMTNRPCGTLYIGVTNDMAHRAYEHREKLVKGFTRKYNLTRLLYYEEHGLNEDMNHREKSMKDWKRAWKSELIEKMNPDWRDLYDGIVY